MFRSDKGNGSRVARIHPCVWIDELLNLLRCGLLPQPRICGPLDVTETGRSVPEPVDSRATTLIENTSVVRDNEGQPSEAPVSVRDCRWGRGGFYQGRGHQWTIPHGY